MDKGTRGCLRGAKHLPAAEHGLRFSSSSVWCTTRPIFERSQVTQGYLENEIGHLSSRYPKFSTSRHASRPGTYLFFSSTCGVDGLHEIQAQRMKSVPRSRGYTPESSVSTRRSRDEMVSSSVSGPLPTRPRPRTPSENGCLWC